MRKIGDDIKGSEDMEHPLDPRCACPAGHDDCSLLGEVLELRSEVHRLLQLTITDPLTNLYNFRHLLSVLDQEMERTRRTGVPTGLVMIDLDHFKQVNDSYGHYVGDRVLQWVGHQLKENVRRIDIPFRYGGEEFAIVLPGTDLGQTASLAKRLQKLMTMTALELGSFSIASTASFGVAAYVGENDISVRMFLDSADRMLLEAKARGRNQVCVQDEDERRAVVGVTSDERAALFASENSGGSAGKDISNKG